MVSEATADSDTPAAGSSMTSHTNGDWTAVWSPEAQAYYFWNKATQETTWTNPLASSASDTAKDDGARENPVSSPQEEANLHGIDPELAYLDPKLGGGPLEGSSAGAQPTFSARFHARTGRFQADPSRNPDRVSDFNRAERQQQAFYDTKAWQEELNGQGVKSQLPKRKPTAKEVEQFKKKRVEKKKKKLAAWMAD